MRSRAQNERHAYRATRLNTIFDNTANARLLCSTLAELAYVAMLLLRSLHASGNAWWGHVHCYTWWPSRKLACLKCCTRTMVTRIVDEVIDRPNGLRTVRTHTESLATLTTAPLAQFVNRQPTPDSRTKEVHSESWTLHTTIATSYTTPTAQFHHGEGAQRYLLWLHLRATRERKIGAWRCRSGWQDIKTRP